MRITFVTSKINFESGGGSVPDLDCKVRDMQHLGADVRVITLFSELNKLPALPYPVIEEQTPSKQLHKIQARVFRTLRAHERDTDVFHVEGQFAYGAALYRLLGGKPIVVFYNRELLVWGEKAGIRATIRSALEKFLCRFLVPRIDHFIFTAPQLAELYRAFGLRIPPHRLTLMLDFFDAEAIRQKTPQRSLAPTDIIRIFTSGRMIQQKGFHLLLEAIGRLPTDMQARLSITISGDGPEREHLIEQARRLGISSQISFPGWVSKEEFFAYLRSADIFVMPRWRLELPSVIVMEALALGVPTVAPGGGGVEWMAGGSIATFTDNDVSSLNSALRRLIGSQEERTRLREAAAKRVREIDHMASRPKLFSIFSSLAA